eukprot:2689609-Pyramimonas_sp.AAC.2
MANPGSPRTDAPRFFLTVSASVLGKRYRIFHSAPPIASTEEEYGGVAFEAASLTLPRCSRRDSRIA